MKIDCRFVLDLDKKEIDVGAGEGARKDAGDDKVYQDEGKLAREVKDIIDNLIQNCIDMMPKELIACILQIKGNLSYTMQIWPKVFKKYFIHNRVFCRVLFRPQYKMCMRWISSLTA